MWPSKPKTNHMLQRRDTVVRGGREWTGWRLAHDEKDTHDSPTHIRVSFFFYCPFARGRPSWRTTFNKHHPTRPAAAGHGLAREATRAESLSPAPCAQVFERDPAVRRFATNGRTASSSSTYTYIPRRDLYTEFTASTRPIWKASNNWNLLRSFCVNFLESLLFVCVLSY